MPLPNRILSHWLSVTVLHRYVVVLCPGATLLALLDQSNNDRVPHTMESNGLKRYQETFLFEDRMDNIWVAAQSKVKNGMYSEKASANLDL